MGWAIFLLMTIPLTWSESENAASQDVSISVGAGSYGYLSVGVTNTSQNIHWLRYCHRRFRNCHTTQATARYMVRLLAVYHRYHYLPAVQNLQMHLVQLARCQIPTFCKSCSPIFEQVSKWMNSRSPLAKLQPMLSLPKSNLKSLVDCSNLAQSLCWAWT